MAQENQMTQRPTASPQAGRIGEQNKRKETTAAPPVSGSEMFNQAKERLRTFRQDTNDYIRKKPTKAVFTALGIGFVLGLMRRR